jgi:hypothetical protein
MPAALFEEQFNKFFDYDTGERKLRCISRATIPQDADEDPALARICTGNSPRLWDCTRVYVTRMYSVHDEARLLSSERSTGRASLPDVCGPDMERRCDVCGEVGAVALHVLKFESVASCNSFGRRFALSERMVCSCNTGRCVHCLPARGGGTRAIRGARMCERGVLGEAGGGRHRVRGSAEDADLCVRA